MISCTFEKGQAGQLRHVVTHAIVEKDGKLLLVKRAGDILETGKWALPGGFLNRDETGEEGALRELLEETGWTGKIISLFRINTKPVRPGEDRQNVVFEYLIHPLEKIGIPDHESSAVDWVSIDNLPSGETLAFDHGESIELYLTYRTKHISLPIIG